ncbi:MAG: hypothetical protein JF886_12680 [Candidatus Dormibacteraeota bacterium]|uniref:Cohesin domain-containing protein n=1 Tax=Candidatus Aeolococcus gillhamiae TaxID=3127015 RepID=A0A934JU05_9BACT|nr:hypothetical protein [Candidatus Dormibacteraeota bacterium]
MRLLRRLLGPACVAVLLACVSGCGDDTKLPQAPSASPFATRSVSVGQQGNARATIDTASVTFKLDESRSLVAHLTVRSTAKSTIAISIRGSLYDPHHALIGDVSGGQINVSPGSATAVELTGPAPLGTIASVTFELTAKPTPP